MLVKVVELLTPLTALIDGAVRRSDLSTEQALQNAHGYIGITTSLWSGRQDLDIIALYKHQRQHFEQLHTILMVWRRDQSELKLANIQRKLGLKATEDEFDAASGPSR